MHTNPSWDANLICVWVVKDSTWRSIFLMPNFNKIHLLVLNNHSVLLLLLLSMGPSALAPDAPLTISLSIIKSAATAVPWSDSSKVEYSSKSWVFSHPHYFSPPPSLILMNFFRRAPDSLLVCSLVVEIPATNLSSSEETAEGSELTASTKEFLCQVCSHSHSLIKFINYCVHFFPSSNGEIRVTTPLMSGRHKYNRMLPCALRGS
jgi:hypothetical protein